MNEVDFASVRAPVVMRCSTTVGGREIAAMQEVPRVGWDDADELMREHIQNLARSALERIVMGETGDLPDYAAIAQAPVQVHVPTELEDQLYREMLADAERDGLTT